MKKSIIALAVFQAALLLSAGEILKNNDFANGLENWHQFKGKKPLVKPEIITENGKKCFQFAKEKDLDANIYYNIKLAPGKYTISYETKADPASTPKLGATHVYIYAKVMKNGKKEGICHGYTDEGYTSCIKKLDNGWIRLSRVIEIPEGMETSLIHFVVNPKYEGTVLFRNMSVQGPL